MADSSSSGVIGLFGVKFVDSSEFDTAQMAHSGRDSRSHMRRRASSGKLALPMKLLNLLEMNRVVPSWFGQSTRQFQNILSACRKLKMPEWVSVSLVLVSINLVVAVIWIANVSHQKQQLAEIITKSIERDLLMGDLRNAIVNLKRAAGEEFSIIELTRAGRSEGAATLLMSDAGIGQFEKTGWVVTTVPNYESETISLKFYFDLIGHLPWLLLLATGCLLLVLELGRRRAQHRERAVFEARLVKESEEAKRTLAIQIAHDIRAPVGALIALAKVSEDLPTAQRDLLNSAVDRIQSMANQLLATHRTEFTAEATALNSVVQAAPLVGRQDALQGSSSGQLTSRGRQAETSSSSRLRPTGLSLADSVQTIEQIVAEFRMRCLSSGSALEIKTTHRSWEEAEIQEDIADTPHLEQETACSNGRQPEDSGSLAAACVMIEPVDFSRVLTNLVQNSVDAVDSQSLPHNLETERVQTSAHSYSKPVHSFSARPLRADSVGEQGTVRGQFKPGRIRVETELIDQSILIVRVIDNGVGMSEATLSQLGKREFSSGKANISHSGSGVGFMSTKQIVERAGGLLRVESRLGAGTIVTVELPLRNTV